MLDLQRGYIDQPRLNLFEKYKDSKKSIQEAIERDRQEYAQLMKEVTLEAHRDLIKLYRGVTSKNYRSFFRQFTCPLCLIHYDPRINFCLGCQLANANGSIGCSEERTFDKARHTQIHYLNRTHPSWWRFIKMRWAFYLRARRHRRALKTLKTIPAWRFTPVGWKYFNEIKHYEV